MFREVGVGPWSETHPGVPRPDDHSSPDFDSRYDSKLLDEGDRRNVLDRFRYWSVEAIKSELDRQGRHGFEVAVENWTHDFNIGSMVRTANAFGAKSVHIVGPHKWNRKGSLMTELYQHVDHYPSIESLVDAWHCEIAGEIARAEEARDRIYDTICGNGMATKKYGASYMDAVEGTASCRGTDGDDASDDEKQGRLEQDERRYREIEREARESKIIALDIIPGAVPIETYRFPARCLLLFGAEGPGLSRKAVELADDVVYISQFGSVRSINAGAAAAVAMHCCLSQHL